MQTVSKKEVSCKAFDPVFFYAKQSNIKLESIIVGVPYDLSYFIIIFPKIIKNDLNEFIKNIHQDIIFLYIVSN